MRPISVRSGFRLLALAVFASGFLGGMPVAKAQQRCVVTDPTGTPLNIRSRPNGAVIGRMGNGVQVAILAYTADDRGRPWALVRLRGGDIIEGWVFREFVTCY
jgi:hypothetical protein